MSEVLSKLKKVEQVLEEASSGTPTSVQSEREAERQEKINMLMKEAHRIKQRLIYEIKAKEKVTGKEEEKQ